MNIFKLPLRKCDDQGCGHFGASRGSRRHSGIDIAVAPGTPINSPVDGVVTKLGWPYGSPSKSHIRYVEITKGGYKYRVFYVDPQVGLGDHVSLDTVIGHSQKLGGFYRGITEHVHFEVKNPEGKKVDPTPIYHAMQVG